MVGVGGTKVTMMSQKVGFISLMNDLRHPGCIIRSSASSWLESQNITREYALRVFQRKGVPLGNICSIFGRTLGVQLSISNKKWWRSSGLPWMGGPLLVIYLARWSFSCILGHLHGSSNNQRTQKYAPSLSLLLLHFHVLRAHWFPAQGPRPVLNLLYSWVYLCPIMQFHFNRKRQYLHGPIGI